ncbi:M23 family metallopeptidase [Modestobacter marinus]|uniref:M23 family metallopeptidase n=1 Tax=Modestobacter marinus TaxID=477641 RepID=UPI001C980DE0|nr:M23 family metallopeptidase [Modestobacter marinus]
MSQRTQRPDRPAGRSRLLAGALAALVAGAVLVGGAGSAAAVPVNPSDEDITGAQTAQDAAAAEVGRLAGLVAAAEAQLEQAQVQAEAAGAAYLAAEEVSLQAQAAAARAAAELRAATDAVTAAQRQIAEFSRDSYMNGSTLSAEMALLDADGPAELVQTAAMLDYVADHQLDVLDVLEIAQVQQANADSTARALRDEAAAAEQAAGDAKAAADGQLAAQQNAVAEVAAQKASLDQQLQAAQVRLLELQGARNAYEAWLAQKRAEEEAAARAAAEAQAADQASDAAAGSGYARPARGTTSSCYGARWGVTHLGVDIAAPIGTPVRAATNGVVQRAGAATGFGLAVYIRGDDGAITVYGHVNEYYVQAGDRVSAGETIGEVGNRGQSTGPHLHFEVHPSGSLYSGAVDPVPWMAARGITIRGC